MLPDPAFTLIQILIRVFTFIRVLIRIPKIIFFENPDLDACGTLRPVIFLDLDPLFFLGIPILKPTERYYLGNYLPGILFAGL